MYRSVTNVIQNYGNVQNKNFDLYTKHIQFTDQNYIFPQSLNTAKRNRQWLDLDFL